MDVRLRLKRPPVAHMERHREVARVLVEEGLFWLVDATGLSRFAPARRAKAHEPGDVTTEQHIRHAIERLGVTFIKGGQALSTRTDVIPPALASELSKLQDEVPPEPFDVARRVIESELESSLEEAFETFDEVPVGAASIGQVYRATLRDGTPVAVKVQRPGVRELAITDVDIVLGLVRIAQSRVPELAAHDVVGLASDLADALLGEFDYTREARNTERLRRAFEGDDTVRIPRVYWSHTTSKVLTAELFEGIRMNRMDELDASGLDRSALALNGINAYLHMIFDVGLFHADPHPGNFIALEGDRIGFTDFGRVGTMSDDSREGFIDLLGAVIVKDQRAATGAMLALATAPDIDEAVLEKDVAGLIAKYHGKELARIDTADLFGDALVLFRRQRLGMPNDFAIMFATLAELEGVGKMLDPGFDFASAVAPFVDRALKGRLRPAEIADRILSDLRRGARILEHLPAEVDRILRRASRGEFRVEVVPRDYENLLDRISELVNRLAFAIVVAALIVGATTLLKGTELPAWVIYTGEGGLVLALLISLWLFASIFASHYRARRR